MLMKYDIRDDTTIPLQQRSPVKGAKLCKIKDGCFVCDKLICQ